MNKEERENMMQLMKDNFEYQEEPKLGIFWYNAAEDVLFGVVKADARDVQFVGKMERKTVSSLHKSWWTKQKMRYRTGREKNKIFETDYAQIPRGRIFQRKADGVFEVMCGSWMNEHILDLVTDEFDLQTQKVETVIDEHWEIGHGWSGDFL
ncbi:hypothetical protein FACS189429_3230 [Bacteroidia bacterium]|nr:hypothetical protein FACS189429_3230 [Bacteroidia bacterium]GHV45047.1 hypothetical protein FACS1894180_7140 [Bacteroidia bacterium]